MEIRSEQPQDIDAVRSLTAQAFRGIEHSHQTEAAIIDALRAAGVLTLSLVAVEGEEVVGHVAFSPVSINGEFIGWYGLGPVAVRPGRQRKGIGTALIREGLAALARMNAQGCVVLGDPAYYARFGFRADADLHLFGVPTGYFQSLSFAGATPEGLVGYHSGFDVA